MVNFDKVKERVMKGAFVGVGSFGSSFLENIIQDNLFDSVMAIGVAELAVGAGMSIGVDEVFSDTRSIQNNAVEFAGYGVQGAAWSSLADSIQTGAVAGTERVQVRSDGGSSDTVRVVENGGQSASGADFEAEVA